MSIFFFFIPSGDKKTYYLRKLSVKGNDLQTDHDSAYWLKAYAIQVLQMCCRYSCFYENFIMQSQ